RLSRSSADLLAPHGPDQGCEVAGDVRDAAGAEPGGDPRVGSAHEEHDRLPDQGDGEEEPADERADGVAPPRGQMVDHGGVPSSGSPPRAVLEPHPGRAFASLAVVERVLDTTRDGGADSERLAD